VYLVMASVGRAVKREGFSSGPCAISMSFYKRDMDSDSTLCFRHLSEGKHVVGLGLDFRVGESGEGAEGEGRSWGW
jgi:hypothetical protein